MAVATLAALPGARTGTRTGGRPGARTGASAEGADGAAAGPGLLRSEDAFAAFYTATANRLWAYLRRLSGDAAVADDILQEAYLKLLHHPPGEASRGGEGGEAGEGAQRALRAYLYRIATNLLWDRRRRQQREERGLRKLLLRRSTPGGGGRDLPLSLDLGAAFAGLKPRERALLWLAHVEGYEHREIARILGLKQGSIRVLLFRARKKMAGALETGTGSAATTQEPEEKQP